MGKTVFGAIPEKYTKYDNAACVILPVPYDETSTWIKGSANGPDAILEASANMELYDIETDTHVYKKGIFTAKPVVENKSPENLIAAVGKEIKGFLKDDKFIVTIGGNHTVSIGAFPEYGARYHDLTILQLDAHADLRQTYDGSRFNHACSMARAREVCPVLQVGIRSMCEEEKYYLDNERVFYSHDILNKPLWYKRIPELLSDNVYVTIDLDVFDPSVMPSTGTPEPGGLFYYDVLHFLKYINEHSNIVGCDVVELCPNEQNKAPDFLAAKLIYQILSYKFKYHE